MSDPKKKGLDFDLNLIPFIDVLSVCISFLMLTALGLQLGSINTKQAIGSASESAKKQPALWAQMGNGGTLEIKINDAPNLPAKYQKLVLPGLNGKADLATLDKMVAELRSVVPHLTMALIVPNKNVVYEDVISLMDHLAGMGLTDLGVSPF